jgi:hypothetical protein
VVDASQGDFLRGAVDVIAVVIVAALGNGNDRVAVIHAVNGRAPPSRCSLVRSSDGIDHVHAVDHVPERATSRGTPTFRGAATPREQKAKCDQS